MRERERVLQVRCTDLEIDMVRALSEQQGLSVSDTVRQLVRQAHARTFGPPKPAKPKGRA